MNRYPIYIISKGRWESRLTSRALERMQIPYHIVVEETEFDKYAEVIDKEKILILPQKYKDDYDILEETQTVRSKGSGPARNFVWQHSIDSGAERHWILDDNIRGFFRLNNNQKIRVYANVFQIMEDFVDRYENVGLAGPNYDYFVPRKSKFTPFSINTRIFSCILIKNDLPFRWQGLYNEDVILSIETLKRGLCTIQFYAFLQEKAATQSMKGGNTDELYRDGTLEKSKILINRYPDIAKLVWRYNRWHHEIDDRAFRMNKLIKKKNGEIPEGINNYGMELKQH